MPIPLIAAAAILGGVTGLAKSGFGISQIIKGNKLEDENVRPTYEIQDEYFANRGIAASRAQYGLAPEAMQFYQNQASRGLSASIDANLQGGGNANNIAGAIDNYYQNLYGVAAKSSEMQNNNIKYFIERNLDVAGQKTQKWAIDKYEPYKDTARAAAESKDGGIKNLFGGAGETLGALSSYATATNYSNLSGNVGRASSPAQNFASQIRAEGDIPSQINRPQLNVTPNGEGVGNTLEQPVNSQFGYMPPGTGVGSSINPSNNNLVPFDFSRPYTFAELREYNRIRRERNN